MAALYRGGIHRNLGKKDGASQGKKETITEDDSFVIPQTGEKASPSRDWTFPQLTYLEMAISILQQRDDRPGIGALASADTSPGMSRAEEFPGSLLWRLAQPWIVSG